MLYGINILGFIYNWRKAFLGLGVMALLGGLALGVRHYYYEWHVEPLEVVTQRANRLSQELDNTKELLRACKSKKRVEVFSAQNHTVFDCYRMQIKEMENEKKELNVSGPLNYDWMYQ